MSDVVERLQGYAEWQTREGRNLRQYNQNSPSMPELAEMHEESKQAMLDAVAEIARLREKCDKQAAILQKLMPENFPGVYFICGEAGEKDQNGLPEKIMVVPSYGCDWHMVYERAEKTFGPEW